MSFNSDMKKARAKKAKIDTHISDIRLLYNAGDQLYHRGVGSNGKLMRLAYAGVERLAGLTAHSYIGQFLAYHKVGFSGLAGMSIAGDMIKFVEAWQSTFEKEAKSLARSTNEITAANKFAYSMMNGDGKVAKNLPPQFLMYYEHAADFDDAYEDFKEQNFKHNWDSVTRTKKMKSIPELSGPYSRGLNDWEDRLGLIILMRARDVASAYLFFANEHNNFVKAGEKANKMLKKVQKSKGSGDKIASKGSEKKAYLDLLEGIRDESSKSSSDIDQQMLFYSGDWKETSSYKKADSAIKELHDLSHKWNQWAYNVKLDVHLQSY